MKDIIICYKLGEYIGICLVCLVYLLVIEVVLCFDLLINNKVLIEVMFNQVNQFGGYIGMQLVDFCDFVYNIVCIVGFLVECIIFGGDYFGLNCW